MAINQTDVISFAMFLYGGKRPTSTADDTKSMKNILRMWELSYRGQLELPHNWKFAIVRTQLNADTDPVIGHYDYRYKLPSKCLRVIAVIDEDDDELYYPYRREMYVDGNQNQFRCILTDQDECFIRYLRDVDAVDHWPAWFCRLVAVDLAILLCEPLKQDKQKKNQLLLMRDEPVYGLMARAIQANDMEDTDTTEDNLMKDMGNNEVLDAPSDDVEEYKYIRER